MEIQGKQIKINKCAYHHHILLTISIRMTIPSPSHQHLKPCRSKMSFFSHLFLTNKAPEIEALLYIDISPLPQPSFPHSILLEYDVKSCNTPPSPHQLICSSFYNSLTYYQAYSPSCHSYNCIAMS